MTFSCLHDPVLYDNNGYCALLQAFVSKLLGASQQVVYSEVCLLHHLGGFQPAHNLRGFFLPKIRGIQAALKFFQSPNF